jgi:D-alanine-D-alanine ligase
MTHKVRVGVLFGGQSGEHEVSLVSARAIMDGLDPEKYDIIPIGITKQGRWIIAADAHARLLVQADPSKLPGGSISATTTASTGISDQEMDPGTLIVAGEHSPLKTLDVIFPVLHGPMGEDGTVQGLLELIGVPYVGCGVLASAVGMDKAMTKVAFSGAGLPVLPWVLVRRREWEHEPQRGARLD